MGSDRLARLTRNFTARDDLLSSFRDGLGSPVGHEDLHRGGGQPHRDTTLRARMADGVADQFIRDQHCGPLRPDATVAMRCALIEAEKANYPIAWMCRQLNVPRSSFYAWRAAADTVTATAARRRMLAQLVQKVFDSSRGTYGCRRVAAELNRLWGSRSRLEPVTCGDR
jgi:hypothetical protein